MPLIEQVAVLGAGGTMGFPMARNMARAGLGVRAWNRSAEKAEPLKEAGVTVASTPAEAADRAQAIVTMPADPEAGLEAMDGGEAGAGSRLKLVTNSWVLTVVEGTAEAIAMAQGIGVEPSQFLEAVGGGPLDMPYLQLKAKAMIDRDFEPSFRLALAAKDARLL